MTIENGMVKGTDGTATLPRGGCFGCRRSLPWSAAGLCRFEDGINNCSVETFFKRPQLCYGDFGVRWHDTAFLPGDMSPGSKAPTCPRTPNKISRDSSIFTLAKHALYRAIHDLKCVWRSNAGSKAVEDYRSPRRYRDPLASCCDLRHFGRPARDFHAFRCGVFHLVSACFTWFQLSGKKNQSGKAENLRFQLQGTDAQQVFADSNVPTTPFHLRVLFEGFSVSPFHLVSSGCTYTTLKHDKPRYF